MKTVLATIFMLSMTGLAQASAMTKEEIAKLPQDKVAVIKSACAQKWNDDYDMRIYCEDNQYKALRILIDRNN